MLRAEDEEASRIFLEALRIQGAVWDTLIEMAVGQTPDVQAVLEAIQEVDESDDEHWEWDFSPF